MRYVGGTDDAGQPIEIKDPMAETLAEIIASTADGEERVKALLALNGVFGDQLPQEEKVVQAIQAAYADLQRIGAKKTVAKYVG
jgi:fructuronate reductase